MDNNKPATNYIISSYKKIDGGKHVFLMQFAEKYFRVGEALPAIFDYDDNGQIYRIEILYLQAALEKLDRELNWHLFKEGCDLIFQFGNINPTCFIFWLSKLQKKSSSHISSVAWLLEDEDGEVVGIEAIIYQ